MTSALITGASGFIGQHLARALRQRGVRVTCLVRRTSQVDALEGCALAFGDVLDRPSVQAAVTTAQPDVIYHLAGLTKARRDHDLFQVNAVGTDHVLSAARDAGGARVIVTSTLAVAGPAEAGPRREEDAPAPVSHYGRSKLQAEHTCREYADALAVSIVRPPIVLGPGDRDGLEMFKSVARWGTHAVPGRAPMHVSWIHVDDLVHALQAVEEGGQTITAEKTSAQGIYFAASPEIVEYGQLGALLGQALGRPVRILRTPAVFVWGIAALHELRARLTGKLHIMNFDKAREATAGSWSCLGERLTRDTGFVPRHDLPSTLGECAAWYRQAGWL